MSLMKSQRFAITPLKYLETQPLNDFFRIIAKMEISFGLLQGFVFGINYYDFEAEDNIECVVQVFIGIVAIEFMWYEST